MDMNQYLSMFIDESNDHLQSLNESMMGLEANPEDISIVQVIFRSAHTLKGMAATMGFEDLASLTHQMENVLDLVRNNKLRMQDFIFDTLFKSLDALESMVQDITAGGEGKADVTAIVSALQAIVRGEIPAAGGAASALAAQSSAEVQITLDEFQYSVLDQSLQEGHQVLYIDVAIRKDCQLKAVRAYMVFDLLERSGEVVKSFPSVQDIEQEKFDHSFSLYYITQKGADEMKSMIMNVSEIDTVTAVALDQESLAQMALEAAATAEAPAPVQEAQAAPAASIPAAPAGREENAAKAAPSRTGGAPSRTIRVDIERLDVLMNLFSELLIDRVRLEQLASEVQNSDLTETVEHMGRVSGDLQNIVMKLRMVPVDTVFNRFPRMVRDLAKSLDKKIDLIITGAETELDRTVIDEIGDPLVHLLRNAVDHGVESVQDRTASGKPETGTVNLRAFHSGNHVFIEIEDDGAGIKPQKILQSAIKKGIITQEQAAGYSDDEAIQLLFAPGFSTAEVISDVSGRGVGLDVVKSKITSLGGNVVVYSTPGKGTNFSVQLPLTLSIIAAMLVKIGSEKYAIPLSSIVETGIVKKTQIRTIHGTRMIEFRNSHIPLLSLSKFYAIPDFDESTEEETEIVVIRKGERLAALAVQDFIGQNEIVIKNLGKYLPEVQGISGATILGDGQVALIIDPNAFIK
ncbi:MULTISPECIES: chemotaxis protein CheA [unclassified Paenibacillus]|uniref:chemotaxis protein CheA n=1 Tax=unclassified Paenibacillus TaxID=185978 RepID=UPI002406DE9E|nr:MULTISPECIES: chemotaxis protein CheA [unclassified Paenibacillus]MDF9841363.1 two-component system chemotaxis sensor kinase CheA [Paenibacillus sp. PastF-2]MDF9847954.1 two-component system chemotaxis sensor kinase CheA [Paenibacillus sp. PastM-2]MDF9854522.1 two-component system chemotaxis sensor kinase CheA [Paenibacillus sp. PastF-1]MDH6479869.1 two-component system chemotaxis sensor kinase CheA [Paenibacillus sp. PastH-2]MDH6507229.1 two-component system chemotaxis sensor kinase CheA [